MPGERLTLIMLAYNSVDTIADTLTSLQRQGPILDRLEAVYVADDCSTDSTLDVVRQSWRAKVSLRTLRNDQNIGQWANLNRTIKRIEETDWILVIHADDIAKPIWLQEFVSQIESSPDHVGSICCSWDTIRPDGAVVSGEDVSGSAGVIAGTSDAVRDTLESGCWWHISGCALRRTAFEDVGEFSEILPSLGDWEWLLRCLGRGWSIAYIPRSLIVYREHSKSVSSLSHATNRDVLEALQILQAYREFLGPDQFRRLVLRRATFMLRRTLRSAINISPKRFWGSLRLLVKVLSIAAASDARSRHG